MLVGKSSWNLDGWHIWNFYSLVSLYNFQIVQKTQPEMLKITRGLKENAKREGIGVEFN